MFNKPLFGTSTSTSAFGQPSTSGFGTPAQPAFGVQPQQQQSLFGQSTTNAFGATSTSLFGQNQSSIFGSQPTASAFGQTSTASTFGRPAGMFGSAQPAATGFGTAVSAFGSSTSAFGGTPSAFGSTAPTGTTIKFNPVTGTDTMMKNGVNQQISTRHQCITAMKEYEAKSLEELRMEDYQANRKGGQAGSAFGSITPQAQGTMSIFGQPAATNTNTFGSSLFSQNKPAFGTSIAPTTTTPSLFGSTNTFGQQNKPAFGGGMFGSTPAQTPAQPVQSNIFGTPATQQPFGQQTTTFPAFGAQAQNTAQKTMFGTTQQTSAFGTGLGTTFNTGAAAKPLFGGTGFNTPAIGSTSFPSFSTPATTTTTSLFGQPQQQTSLFPSASKPFNFSSTTPSFGSNLTQSTPQLNTGTNLFSGSGFGTGSLFPSAQPSSLFPNNQPTLSTAFQTQQPNFQSPPANNELLLGRLQALPYGSSSLFQNDLANIPAASAKFTTDPKTLNQYRLSSKAQNPIQRTISVPTKSSMLFDDVEDDLSSSKLTAQDIFCPRKNIKKLIFKHKPDSSPSSTSPEQAASNRTSTQTSPIEQIENTVCEFVKHKPSVVDGDDSVRGQLNFSLDTLPGDESVQSFTCRSSMPQLKCGLILTRGDYYTIPPLDAIDACYKEEDDTCILDNLTIGRKNYGSIYWEGPLDVRGLNLDEIVHIRRKEVIVYPDDEDKPPVGQGLNRPAQVTLDQVWPVDKANNEIIKDVERLDQMNYAAKIEAATVKLKATFRDYRPETGSWVFCVRHFSKYGLAEDEEDEPMAVGGVEKVVPLHVPISQRHEMPSELPINREIPEKTVIHKINAFSSAMEHRFMDFPRVEDFSLRSGFSKFEERFQPPTDIYGGLRNVLFNEEGDEEEITKPSPKQKKQKIINFEMSPVPVHPRPRKRQEPTIHFSIHQKRNLDFKTNPFPSENKLVLDISSIKNSPCSRVCFFNGSNNFVLACGNTINITAINSPFQDDEIEEKMDSQFNNNSLLHRDPNAMAFIEPRSKLCNPKNNISLNNLVSALYGDLKTSTAYEQFEERINRVVEWLGSRNKKYRVQGDAFSRIVHYLCTNEVQLAVQEALKSKQPRLALLLSTATCSASKEYLLFQLDSWKTSGADLHIDRQVLKLYVLMSGIMKWDLSNGEEVFAMDNLSWSQQLILMLKYNANNDLLECIENLPTDSTDVEYHLLAQMEGNQWETLNYCTNSLECWLLHQSLTSFGVLQNDPRSDVIHGELISSVISRNTRWSVFIAQHILDDDLRHFLVTEVLSRNSKSLKNEDESWLAERLAVKKPEIAAAKTLFFKATFEDVAHSMALLDSCLWIAAHKILVEKIFPELVINEELDMLSNLVERLKPRRDLIPNWYTDGGHVYEVYLAAKLGSEEGVLALLQKSMANIHLMKCPTNRHVLAQSEIAVTLNRLSKAGDLTDGSHVFGVDGILAQLRANCSPIVQNLVL